MAVSGRDVTLVRGGAGPRLLYLHGLCDIHAVWAGEQWTPFLARLAASFDVVAPALPGYNASAGLEDFDDELPHAATSKEPAATTAKTPMRFFIMFPPG